MFRFSELSKFFEMRCSHCKTILVKGEKEQFTNTAEHVLDPNEEYERPMRDTWICPNCQLKTLVFWDEQGSLYVTGSYREYHKIIALNKKGDAIFSWSWFYENFDNKIWWFKYRLRSKFQKMYAKN